MPISTQLQAQIDAIQTRIDTLAPSATPEDIVMLAKAVEAVGGQATVFDVIDTGQLQKAELIATANLKSAEVIATGDAQVDRVAQQGDLKFNELSQEVQRYAAFGGATQQAPGTLGMVPAPPLGGHQGYLRGDGAWGHPGEIPIGAIALIHPNMAPERYLPAEGGTVLIEDYPALFDVLGQAPTSLPSYSVGVRAFPENESVGYSNHRAAAVSGERAVILRGSGIQFSSNGGLSWSKASISGIDASGYWPALSDTGRTVGWVKYNSGASPYPITGHVVTAATFGAWAGSAASGGESFSPSKDSIVLGLAQGIAFIGNSVSNTSHVYYKYAHDGDAAITHEVNLSATLDARITSARGALRVGQSLYLLVDGSGWRALLRTGDAGANWAIAWEGAGSWGDCNLQHKTQGSFTRQDAGQPAYVENGLGIVHSATELLLIAADGALSWVDQPAGHSLIAGSVHFVDGYYYAASAGAVFRTADFQSWEQLSTAFEILGGPGSISRMWVHSASASFGFHSAHDALVLVQTRNFLTFKRNRRPSRWGVGVQITRMAFTGDRFIWLIVRQSSSSNYFDYALFDLVTGWLYAQNYFTNHGDYPPYPYWLVPLPGGRWLHYTTHYNNYYANVASPAHLYTYNLDTEFRLPVSSGDFYAVGAYGSQTTMLYSTDGGARGGYRYYVRAQ